jgi:hypothetical protein
VKSSGCDAHPGRPSQPPGSQTLGGRGVIPDFKRRAASMQAEIRKGEGIELRNRVHREGRRLCKCAEVKISPPKWLGEGCFPGVEDLGMHDREMARQLGIPCRSSPLQRESMPDNRKKGGGQKRAQGVGLAHSTNEGG